MAEENDQRSMVTEPENLHADLARLKTKMEYDIDENVMFNDVNETD